MDLRRQHPRLRVFRKGKIVFNNGSSIHECVVKDLSDGGAALILAPSIGVPEAFDLVIGEETGRPSRIVWRGPDRIGVQFTALPQTVQSVSPEVRPGPALNRAALRALLRR